MNTRKAIALFVSCLALTACGEDAPAVEATPTEIPAPPEAEPEAAPVTVGTVAPPSAEALARATETGTLARAILADATAGEAALTAAGLSMEILVDINVGMNRTGVEPGPAALELYESLTRLPGISPGGLHVYDGHQQAADFGRAGK